MELTLNLDLLAPVDWRMLRAARLKALLDSPDAFTSSYAHESRWEESDPTWAKLVRTFGVDRGECLADVVGQWVFGGQCVAAGVDLDGAVAA